LVGEWHAVRLGDVADLLAGYPYPSAEFTDDQADPRLLRGDNVGQGALRWDGAKRWSSRRTDGLDDYWLQRDDVILAMDRPWIEAGLKFAAVRDGDLPSLLVQRVSRIRGGSRLDGRYLKHVIASRSFTDYILSVQTGTTIPHISAKQILDFRFRLPPVAEQRSIAGILGALDDKIELNRRTSETLEAMARALFKSWFVDFEPVRARADGADTGLPTQVADLFPVTFEDSDRGPIPAGWTVSRLDEIATYLNGLALQKYPPDDDGWLPVIKIAQLRAGHTAGADRAGVSVPSEYIVQDGDVLFSWSGSLEVELWCGGIGALNQHLFKVTSDRLPKWFYLLWTREHLADFRQIAAGKATTMGHIQRGHLSAARALVPPPPLLDAMSRQFEPLLEGIVARRLETRTLAALRDALLPRLISGELDLSRAERQAPGSLP
jgi:type I restriction enzyme S subunit